MLLPVAFCDARLLSEPKAILVDFYRPPLIP